MRFDGILTSWNEDGAYGFIRPSKGGQNIFAHISAFPGGGARPLVGESLSFEVELNADGKKRAKAIQRPRAPSAPPAPRQPAKNPWQTVAMASVMLLFAAGAYFEYQRWQRAEQGNVDSLPVAQELQPAAFVAPAKARSSYSCDGRTHCSQMRSCEEATFFTENCPDTKMDGNHDGVPCETQWCPHPG